MNPSLILTYKCPYCEGEYKTSQSRNAHKGKCNYKPTPQHVSTPFDIMKRLNQQIKDCQGELKEYYKKKEEVWQQILKEFNLTKDLVK